MNIIIYQQTIVGSTTFTRTWWYDTNSSTSYFQDFPGNADNSVPPEIDDVIYETCSSGDLIQYIYEGGILTDNSTYPDEQPGTTISNVSILTQTIGGSPVCCSIDLADFLITTTPNQSISPPYNGSITIASAESGYQVEVVLLSTNELILDWTNLVGSQLVENLNTGNYRVRIRLGTGACLVSTTIKVLQQTVNVGFDMVVNELDTYLPVFNPIQFEFQFTGNTIQVRQDGTGTYITTASVELQAFLNTLPTVRLFDSADYGGTYYIESSVGNKYYINATYTSDQDAKLIPADRQSFSLVCEQSIGNFVEIAEISCSADVDGKYVVRVEGFLQSQFRVNPPEADIDFSLSKKFYCIPSSFDLVDSYTIYTGVYSVMESLDNYLPELTPLGPSPISFIDKETGKGLPTVFSYIDDVDSKRVRNIYTSVETSLIEAGPEVNIQAIPFEEYSVEWIRGSAIADLQVSPALPDWITVVSSDNGKVVLNIVTQTETGGDYDPNDYNSTDYLTGGINAIVGCYEFVFSDGETELFTLSICVYPAQQISEVCGDGYNLAWVNRQGGWNNFIFDGRRSFGVDVGSVEDFKDGLVSRHSIIEGVFDNCELLFSNRTKKDLILISTLKYSIQAYLYNTQTKQWDIPITIDRSSFPTYSEPFNQANVSGSIRFKYAKELKVQRQ